MLCRAGIMWTQITSHHDNNFFLSVTAVDGVSCMTKEHVSILLLRTMDVYPSISRQLGSAVVIATQV